MIKLIVNTVIFALLIFNLNKCVANRVDIKTERFYRHYFMVMATLLAFDNALSWIFYRIPYYQFFKLITACVMSMPHSQGPYFIYNVYFAQMHLALDRHIMVVQEILSALLQQFFDKYYSIASLRTAVDTVIFRNLTKQKDYLKKMIFKQEPEISQEQEVVFKNQMKLSKSFMGNEDLESEDDEDVCIDEETNKENPSDVKNVKFEEKCREQQTTENKSEILHEN